MSKRKPDTYNRARQEILSYILNFSTVRQYSKGFISHVGGDENTFGGGIDIVPPIGSLCLLGSAPASKWYMSWLVAIEDSKPFPKYLLQSIGDGEKGWWHNVSLTPYNQAIVDKFPRWKWTDRQHEFSSRVDRVFKRKGAYVTLAKSPVFNEDGGVLLSTRERHGFTDYSYSQQFDNWKKVTAKQIGEFYDAAIANKPAKS